MAFGATVRDLRQRNRAKVLREIIFSGETTRGQLAASCRLSAATITNVVSELIHSGLVKETGSVPSDGGRPIARLSVRPEGAYLIGADVGEHGVLVELFDLALQSIDREARSVPITIAGVDEVSEVLTDAIHTLQDRTAQLVDDVIGMGLGLPGLVEQQPSTGDAIFLAESLGWPEVKVRELCNVEVPIFAENGANTLTMAEQWFGAAQDVDNAIVVLVGRGVGAGLISDRALLRGVSGSAGEWGHTTLSAHGPTCTCGDQGCVEAYIGGSAIVNRWRQHAGDAFQTSHTEEDAFDALVKADADGNEKATEVLDESADLLGLGLASLVNLLNPGKIIVGGWAGLKLYRVRSSMLENSVRRHALKWPSLHVTVEPAALGDEAVAVGAALLPLEQLIDGTFPRSPDGARGNR